MDQMTDEEKKETAKALGFRRIESASSINTYRQCPRKYYYQYIKEIPSKESIHLIRGKIVHSILEDFFKIDFSAISDKEYGFELKILIHDLLSTHWNLNQESLLALSLPSEELSMYLEETKEMIQTWFLGFFRKFEDLAMKQGVRKAWEKLKPVTEEYFFCKEYGVHGFIDAILNAPDGAIIVDYKTSKKPIITEDYKVQLAIYALMYHDRFGKQPLLVGINFLKEGEQFINADKELIEYAIRIIKEHHKNTKSENIDDYGKKACTLCKWAKGQCDFYQLCSNS